jgi:ribosomal protein S18 acetylase RimI-like enzyme
VRISSLGFRTDLAIRRLGGSTIELRDEFAVVKTPSNPGYWWGNFILLAAPVAAGSGQALRERFAAEFPAADHMAIGVDGTEGETGDRSTIDALGLAVEIDAVLTAERLRTPRPTAGDPLCRPLRGDDDWTQALTLRRACHDPAETPQDRDFQERTIAQARDICARGHGSWFGAFIDGRLVSSLGLIRTDPATARYQTVETHPDHRRQGLAGRLIYESSLYASERLGTSRLVIVADPDYHAIELYGRLGFTVVEQQAQLALAV